MTPAPTPARDDKPFTRLDVLLGTVYAFALFWINLRICRDFFRNLTAPNNSMHGFWAAMARWADGAWFHASWWPYWDCGIPFELTYAPGVPFLTSVAASIRHVPELLAFNTVSGIVYIAAPLTVFAMVWVVMRAPGWAFIAGLAYSLTSPTQLIVPDGRFAWRAFWDARRMYLTAAWDDTPHLAAVAMLPLVVVFLTLSIRRRRLIYYVAAAVSVAVAALASAFGPTDTAMIALCLLFALNRERIASNLAVVAGIGAYGWAMAAPFVSPALFTAIRESSNRDGTGWNEGSWTALAIAIFGWALIWYALRRWTDDWRLRFFALFAYLTSSVPMIHQYLNRQFLPQPGRYKLEMEMAITVFVVLAIRELCARVPKSIRIGALLVVLALSGEQIASDRTFAKNVLAPADVPAMIESRAAVWAGKNLPGVRVSMPGSIAQWTGLFSPIQQFTGGSWSVAYNQVQQHASDGVQNFEDSARPMMWLKAYGVGAVCVPGPKSPEFWKTVHHQEKFSALPVLWSEDDTTIYAVPQRSRSLARVVPEDAVVRVRPRDEADVASVGRYVAALDDASLPEATFEWQGRNRFVVAAPAMPSGGVVSVQVSWHPGWHALVGSSAKLPIKRDGLGLIWIRPPCQGPCVIQFDYDGGWELRILRWLSYAAAAGLVCLGIWVGIGRFITGQTSSTSPPRQA